MISLELKDLYSPDGDPRDWAPAGNRVFGLLQLDIGLTGGSSSDTFNVVIATPEGLTDLAPVDQGGAVVRRATIVVRTFDWDKVRALIADIIRACEAATWVESVLKLQRYFEWEFEDYIRE